MAAQFFSLMIDFHVFAFVIESRLHSQQSSRPASGERKRYSRYILLLQYHAYKRQTVWFTTREVTSNQISGGPDKIMDLPVTQSNDPLSGKYFSPPVGPTNSLISVLDPRLTSCIASGTTEIQGHCKVWRARP